MNAFLWVVFALTGTGVLVLPPGIYPGVWSAPLESATAWVCIFALWVGCAIAIGLKLKCPSKSLLSVSSILVLIKILLLSISPQPGIRARFTTEGLVSWGGSPLKRTIEKTTPPRPQDRQGWQIHRDAFIPPHFINDHRRFNYYKTHRLKRDDLPYKIEIQGYLIVPNRVLTIVCPAGGRLSVDGEIVSSPQGKAVKSRITGKDVVSLNYATSTTTAFKSSEWILEKQDGKFKMIPKWRWWAQNPLFRNKWKPRVLFIMGRLWNLAFILLIIVIWLKPFLRLWRSLETLGISRWAILIFLVLAYIVPIERGNYFFIRLIASMLLILICGGMLLWTLLNPRFRLKSFFSALSPGSAGLVAVGLCLVVWTILGSRFFDSRFPRGYAILPAGMDTLFHYTYAREILSGDWLHRADAPFHRQPFIRYLLLLPLWVEGEGAAWGFHVHWSIFALTGAILWLVVAAKSTVRAFILFAVWFLAFPFNANKIWVPTLFPETWATFFLVLSYLLVSSAIDKSGKDKLLLVSAGIIFGFAVWTRNNLLTVLPFWFIVLMLKGSHRVKINLKYASIFSVVALLTVGVIPLRNTLLAPEAPFSFLLSPERGATDLFQGFQLKEITQEEIKSSPVLSKLSPATARFLEGIRRHPILFIKYQLDRLFVLFGGPAFWEENLVKFYPKVTPWHLFLWALIIVRILTFGKGAAFGLSAQLCWAVLIAQLGIIFFTGYVGAGYRFLVPVYPFLLLLGFLQPEYPLIKQPKDTAGECRDSER